LLRLGHLFGKGNHDTKCVTLIHQGFETMVHDFLVLHNQAATLKVREMTGAQKHDEVHRRLI
jgi:hypothetical protein